MKVIAHIRVYFVDKFLALMYRHSNFQGGDMLDQGVNSAHTMHTPSVISSHSDFGSKNNRRRLLRKHKSLLFICQVFCNLSVVGIALLICTYSKMAAVPDYYRLLFIITVFLVLVIYQAFGVYKQTEKFF